MVPGKSGFPGKGMLFRVDPLNRLLFIGAVGVWYWQFLVILH